MREALGYIAFGIGAIGLGTLCLVGLLQGSVSSGYRAFGKLTFVLLAAGTAALTYGLYLVCGGRRLS